MTSLPLRSPRSIAPWLVAGAGYLALTVFFTWPLATHLSSVLPHDLGDPLFGTWILWWNAHAVPLTERWWNAPFYWPTRGALGLSEHLLGLSLLATPLQWAGADPVAAYNILFLLSFPLSALAMHALAFTLVRRHDAAVLAGLLFGFSPYRTAQIAHIQMLWTFWMPIALLALHQYDRDGRRRWLVLFGAMWTGQAASNGYLLLFFPVLVACWVAWFLVSRRDLGRALSVTVAAAIGSLPLLPVLIGYRRIHTELSLQRTLTEVRQFSADVTAFVTTAPSLWTWRWLSEAHGAEQELFPGITPVALILAALAISLSRGRDEATPYRKTQRVLAALSCLLILVAATLIFGPWRLSVGGATLVSVGTANKPLALAIWCAVGAMIAGVRVRTAIARRSMFAFYVIAALVMYVCSLGPEPAFRGAAFWYKPPYSWLMELPGYASIRAPARFAMLGTLCLAAAAALALTRLTSHLPRRSALGVGLVCCAVALVDCWMYDLALPGLPPRIRSLEAGSFTTKAIVELPLGEVGADLRALYRSMYHRKPLVNGWAGYDPPSYSVLRAALQEGDIGALDAIPGPLTVVVDPNSDDRQWKPFAPTVAEAAVNEETGHRIFALVSAAPEATTASAPQLSIQSVTASSEIDLRSLTDGNPSSHWESGEPQSGREWVTFDLGAARRVSGIMLAIGPAFSDYARMLAIDASLDGQTWTTIFEGPSAARAVGAALRDPRMVPVSYTFAPIDARWIRARQLGHTEKLPWSISEAAVFGP